MNASHHALSVAPLPALSPRARHVVARVLLVLLIALPCIALATPPSWAPAHGWRKKNDPTYAGYSGRSWNDDYGVRSGRCEQRPPGRIPSEIIKRRPRNQIQNLEA